MRHRGSGMNHAEGRFYSRARGGGGSVSEEEGGGYLGVGSGSRTSEGACQAPALIVNQV